MTLDPVHVDGIANIAAYLAQHVDDTDHTDLAANIWQNFLDPLVDTTGRAVCEPICEQRLRVAAVDDVALAETPFETVHGLDAGTINPTTFKNGLVLDLAQAALAAVPSNLDLHRHRSIVATTHLADTVVSLDEPWQSLDAGYCRWRIMQAPRVDRYSEGVVHALALYLAESSHALEHADAVSELLILDGPLYPVELLNWQDRNTTFQTLSTETKPRSIVENYLRLVESFVERDIPLCGFIKNPASKRLIGTLRDRDIEVPWTDDTAFFTQLLERREQDTTQKNQNGVEGRRTDEITFTSWFVSRSGANSTVAADGDAYGLNRHLDPLCYETCFCVIYEPQHDMLYRLEMPYAFARDNSTRTAVTQQIVSEVAARRGPPAAIAKADELARISTDEKTSLRKQFAESLDADEVKRYDDVRWGDAEYE